MGTKVQPAALEMTMTSPGWFEGEGELDESPSYTWWSFALDSAALLAAVALVIWILRWS